MSDSQRIALYQTDVHPCGYMEDRQAVTLLLDPSLKLSVAGVEKMAEYGFRRSGSHIYRPNCPACRACVPARIKVDEFRPNRSQRKILRRNSDLLLKSVIPRFSLEYYRLYRRYINIRHRDGDMYPPSARQFLDFLCVVTGYTQFWELRKKDSGELMAVAVIDHHLQSLSAMYSFYNPDEPKRSLGTYLILRQIEEAKRTKLPYLYLGYWIDGCRKMSYKMHFLPQEHLIDGNWIDFVPQSQT